MLATARCLARYGHAATSVRQICAEAGVSPGLLGHHFAGKDDLVARTYEFMAAEQKAALMAPVAAAPDDPDARLDAFIQASFRPPVLEEEVLAVWLAFWSLVRTDPAVRALHRGIYADYRATLERFLGQAAASRGVRIDARRAALALSAVLDGLWLEWCLDNSAYTAEEAVGIAREWVDCLLRGKN
jgi:AcrR family transcriptional regulator